MKVTIWVLVQLLLEPNRPPPIPPVTPFFSAVEQHYISLSRYNSYLSMLNDKEEGKYRSAY